MANCVAKSERLWLEPLNVEDHLEAYHALNSDERVTRWSSSSRPRQSMAQSRAELVSRQPSAEQPHLGLYAIMLHRPPGTVAAEKKATFVGSIGLIRLAPDGVSYEVGYGILPEYWGRGYAPEALRLLLAYYWESDTRPQSEIVCAGTEPENLPSQRVLEKAGFTRGATIEKAFTAKNHATGEMEWRAAVMWHVERPKA